MARQTKLTIPPLAGIEKRLWDFVLLAIVLILFLTLALLSLQISNIYNSPDGPLLNGNGMKYTIPLAILILLVCSYMIAYYRKLIDLSRTLSKEKDKTLRLSQDVRMLSSLFHVSSAINSNDNLTAILNVVARAMVHCFQSDNCSIMLLDKTSRKLRTIAVFGNCTKFAKSAEMPIGEGIAGWVLKSGKPLLLNGEVDLEKFPGTPVKTRQIQSAMCVPLKYGSQAIGVLNLNIFDSQRSFSSTHLTLLNVFANNTAMSIHKAILSQEKRKRQRIQNAFEKLHSSSILDYLTNKINTCKEPKDLRTQADICVVFADVRGFSSIISKLDLDICVAFLDDFYNIMNREVVSQGGYVDKFIGDEVMAIFHSDESLNAACTSAIKAAQRMILSFDILKENVVREHPDFDAIGLGIGLNAGQVYIGGIGSSNRMDYTVIGPPVNLARQLCAYADSDQILVTRELSKKVDNKTTFEFVDNVYFVGLTDPIEVCQVEIHQPIAAYEAA